jgi:hypothetical protein
MNKCILFALCSELFVMVATNVEILQSIFVVLSSELSAHNQVMIELL